MSHRPSEPPDREHEPRTSYEDDDYFRHDDRRAKLGVSDFVRRAIKDTVGSVQTTGSVSKEAIHYLLQQGDKGRRELLRIIASEVGQFLRDTSVSDEVIKVLTGIQIDFSANVKFKPAEKGTAVRPDADLRVSWGPDPEAPSEPGVDPVAEAEPESIRRPPSWSPAELDEDDSEGA